MTKAIIMMCVSLLVVSSMSASDSRQLLCHAQVATAAARGFLVAAAARQKAHGKNAIKLEIARDGVRVLNALIDLINYGIDYDPTLNPTEGSYYSAVWLVRDLVPLSRNLFKYVTGLSVINNKLGRKLLPSDRLEHIAQLYKEVILPILEGGTAVCTAWNSTPFKSAIRRHARSIGSLSRLLDEALQLDLRSSEGKIMFAAVVCHVALTVYEYSKRTKMNIFFSL